MPLAAFHRSWFKASHHVWWQMHIELTGGGKRRKNADGRTVTHNDDCWTHACCCKGSFVHVPLSAGWFRTRLSVYYWLTCWEGDRELLLNCPNPWHKTELRSQLKRRKHFSTRTGTRQSAYLRISQDWALVACQLDKNGPCYGKKKIWTFPWPWPLTRLIPKSNQTVPG